MRTITAEQKDWFLLHIRSGDDRATAAQKVGSTGTQFRRMCNPESPHYDPAFAIAYAEACEERGPIKRENARLPASPRTTTEQGFTKAKYITQEDWDEFLERVREGEPRDKAAREVGTSFSQISRYASRSAERMTELHDAYEQGLPNFKERLRAKAYELAMDGDYRALRDMAIIHLEEWAVLQTRRHEIGGIGGGAMRLMIDQVFPNLPPQLIDGLIQAIEQQQQATLPMPRLLTAPEEAA